MAIVRQVSFNAGHGPGSPFGTQGGESYNNMLDRDVQYQTDAQRDIASGRNAADLEQSRIAADASRFGASYAPNLQQNRFNRIFPFLTSQFAGLQGGMSGTAGGQSGPSPEISVGGILSPSQISQQINAMRAGNDQAGASQMARQGSETAGRGFGSNSPLLAALRGQTAANTLSENVGGEREIRLSAAQQNAQHLLGTQQAREGQFAARQREDIERRKPYFSMANTLLSTLGGMM